MADVITKGQNSFFLYSNIQMKHFNPKQDDRTIELVDDSKECQRMVLLGRQVKIKTLHDEDPFIEETCFINFETMNIPWQDKDRTTVICQNRKRKWLMLVIDNLEMMEIAAESAINAKQLAAVLGYDTTFTLKAIPKTRNADA